jgi:hypothetical protein
MYGRHLNEFIALKGVLDPHKVLRNDFLDRTIGSRP